MTDNKKPEASPTRQRLDQLVEWAQAALLWEKIWPPVALAGTVLLFFLALSWFDVWSHVPPLLRASGVAAFLAMLIYALWPLHRLRRQPPRSAALNRIDRASQAPHRLASALEDNLASPVTDPLTATLWSHHQAKLEAEAKNLRVGLPTPGLARRDPMALRIVAVLLAAVAFITAGGERGALTLSAFDWTGLTAPRIPARLDAWVTPPPYTGRPPIFLTGDQASTDAYTVPRDSIVVVRVSGGDMRTSISGGAKPIEQKDKPQSGASEQRWTLESDADIRANGVTWRFKVLADMPPSVAFMADPQITPQETLSLRYSAKDDYGLAVIDAEITPQPDPNLPKNARPLYGAPEAHLLVPNARGQSGEAETALDLKEHPWAGANVRITLRARDEAGQEARSDTRDATLPARAFADPLARALVEQRRVLAMDAGSRDRVAKALDTLALYPEDFTPKASVYLGLRAGFMRLVNARTDDDLRGVADYLWEMALRIEDGDLGGMERDLRQIEQALRDALERGAPEEEIRKLTAELRAALNRYLEQLAQRMQQNPEAMRQMPPDAKMVTQQDLQRMLDRLEDLARGGSAEAAQQLLSELNKLLNGLTSNQRSMAGQGGSQMNQNLDALGKMIQEQNDLRDRTFQQGQQQQGSGENDITGPSEPRSGQRGSKGSDGQGEGQQQGNGDGAGEGQGQGLGGLEQQQGGLRGRLGDLTRQLQGMGAQGTQQFGEAGEAMQGAEKALREGNTGTAVEAQGKALDALRKGAQQLVEQMMQNGQQGGSQQGLMQIAPGQAENVDPLGRPTRSHRYDPGASVRIPSEIEAQRARRILEELRRRLGEPSRPQGEMDYLERLLP